MPCRPELTAASSINPPSDGDGAERRRTSIGYGAITLTVLIWSGFALSIRAIGVSALTTADVALIRFATPAAILLPLLPRYWTRLRGVAPLHALLIGSGAGLPFFLIASAGGRLTSAAHVGSLIAGTAPLSVALLGALLRQRVALRARYGLILIVAGVGALVMAQAAGSIAALSGITLLLSASLLWGAYTLALRRACIDPMTSTMLVVYPSLALLVAMMAAGFVGSQLSQVSPSQAVPFIAVQGLGVGLGSTFFYTLAIRHLGPMRSATIGAFAPVLTALLAVPVLDESLGLVAMIGVLTVTAGVLLTNTAQ